MGMLHVLVEFRQVLIKVAPLLLHPTLVVVAIEVEIQQFLVVQRRAGFVKHQPRRHSLMFVHGIRRTEGVVPRGDPRWIDGGVCVMTELLADVHGEASLIVGERRRPEAEVIYFFLHEGTRSVGAGHGGIREELEVVLEIRVRIDVVIC